MSQQLAHLPTCSHVKWLASGSIAMAGLNANKTTHSYNSNAHKLSESQSCNDKKKLQFYVHSHICSVRKPSTLTPEAPTETSCWHLSFVKKAIPECTVTSSVEKKQTFVLLLFDHHLPPRHQDPEVLVPDQDNLSPPYGPPRQQVWRGSCPDSEPDPGPVSPRTTTERSHEPPTD